MLSKLEIAVARDIGLLIRWDSCAVIDLTPWESAARQQAPRDGTRVLHQMAQVATDECVRLLGSTWQVGNGCKGEWETTRHKFWQAFHLRRSFWRLKGSAVEKMRMHHMSIWPVLNWCAGGRFWHRQELSSLYSMMLQMSRRALNFWPQQD